MYCTTLVNGTYFLADNTYCVVCQTWQNIVDSIATGSDFNLRFIPMAAVFGDTYSRSSTHLIVSLQRSQNHSPSIRAISHQTSNADTTIAPTAIRQSQPIVPVKIDPVSQEKDYNITLDNFIAENEAGSARVCRIVVHYSELLVT